MMKTIALFLFLSFSISSYATETFGVEISNDQGAQSFELNEKAAIRISHNFGFVPTNTLVTARYYITNKVNYILYMTRFQSTNPFFQGISNCTEIYPGQRCELTIRYWPQAQGQHFGNLFLELNHQEQFIFNLSGIAQ